MKLRNATPEVTLESDGGQSEGGQSDGEQALPIRGSSKVTCSCCIWEHGFANESSQTSQQVRDNTPEVIPPSDDEQLATPMEVDDVRIEEGRAGMDENAGERSAKSLL